MGHTASDWEYSIANDTWTQLSSINTGTSAMNGANMTFDPATNRLITWSLDNNIIWLGQLSDSGVTVGQAANLVSLNGNGQTGTTGQPLTNPLYVKVTDSNGIPVSGISVTFTVTSGGGTVNPTTVSTNAQGMASTLLTLGPTPGTNLVVVTSGSLSGSPVTFSATATALVSANVYDLNHDGIVNDADVDIAIDQSLQRSPCTTGDVNKDGGCNVLDVQLVITASPRSSTTTTARSATFVNVDSTTAGSWKGIYGADGYHVIGDVSALPSYVTATPSGNSFWVWTYATDDTRGLQKASAAGERLAECWYSSDSFSVDLTFSDGVSHQVALYLLDWNSSNRSQRIDILDSNNNVLDTRSISNFSGGQYLIWNLSGHVIIRISNGAGSPNSVLSGLFFR